MITLFRRLRKKFMEQNKVRTYILYAIGEIFLVVIGILIALQVNNWNEDRNANNELMLSLQSIAKNMSQDIEAEAAKKGDFRNIFDLFFLTQNGKDISNEKRISAIEGVIRSEAIYAAAGRVAITTDVSGGYSELIEVGTEFIELVEATN